MAMEQDSDIALRELQVDGGITSNDFVMQCLADLLGTNVVNIGIQEVSALGAAHLAGLQAGIFKRVEHLTNYNDNNAVFKPGNTSDQETIQQRYTGWINAVKQLN